MVKKTYITVKKHCWWTLVNVHRSATHEWLHKFEFLAPFTVQVLFRIFMGPQVVANVTLVVNINIVDPIEFFFVGMRHEYLYNLRLRLLPSTFNLDTSLRIRWSWSPGEYKRVALKNITVFWNALHIVSCPRSKRRWWMPMPMYGPWWLHARSNVSVLLEVDCDAFKDDRFRASLSQIIFLISYSGFW